MSITVQVGAIFLRHASDSKHGIPTFSKVGLRKTLTAAYSDIKMEIIGSETNVYIYTCMLHI